MSMRYVLVMSLVAIMLNTAEGEEPDPTCATGWPRQDGGLACCHYDCGKCGGANCQELKGGQENCCVSGVKVNERSCADYPPPCNREPGFFDNIAFNGPQCTATVGFYGLQAGETPKSIKKLAPMQKMAFVKKATRNTNTTKQQRSLRFKTKTAFEVVGAVVLAVGICVGTLGAGCAEGAAIVANGAMTLASGAAGDSIGLVSLEQATALVGAGEAEGSSVAYYGSVGYNLEEAEVEEFLALREDELMEEGSEFHFGAEAEEEDGLFGLKYSEVKDRLFDELEFVRGHCSSAFCAFDFTKTNAVPRKLVSFDGDAGACNLVDESFKNDFAQTKVTVTYLTRTIEDPPPRRLKAKKGVKAPHSCMTHCTNDQDHDKENYHHFCASAWDRTNNEPYSCKDLVGSNKVLCFCTDECKNLKKELCSHASKKCRWNTSGGTCQDYQRDTWNNKKIPCPGGGNNCQFRFSSVNGQESTDPDSAVASATSGLVGISSGLVGHVLLALVLLCIAL